jgi:hypothetical protein
MRAVPDECGIGAKRLLSLLYVLPYLLAAQAGVYKPAVKLLSLKRKPDNMELLSILYHWNGYLEIGSGFANLSALQLAVEYIPERSDQ